MTLRAGAGALVAAGVLAVFAGVATPAAAQVPLDAFFPLLTRRPVIEHEIEMRTVHEHRHDTRETTVSLGIKWPILPRWGVALSVPLAFNDPPAAPATAGAGDVELESKAILFASADRHALVTAGLGVTLPTGSERRGLGGETVVEPFAAVGLVAADVLIVSDVGYVMAVGGPHRDQRRIHAGLAVGRPTGPDLIPLLALTAASTLEGAGDRDAGRRGGFELYVAPGLNVQIASRATLGLGVQLPLTRAPSSTARCSRPSTGSCETTGVCRDALAAIDPAALRSRFAPQCRRHVRQGRGGSSSPASAALLSSIRGAQRFSSGADLTTRCRCSSMWTWTARTTS